MHFLISLSLPSPKKRERRKKAKCKNQFSAPLAAKISYLWVMMSGKRGEGKKSASRNFL
jgi:hypothetical protein